MCKWDTVMTKGEEAMDKGITLSEKHGVNPMIPLCFVCQEPKNEIALLGRIKDDAEAPKRACLDMEPCSKCQEYMEKGIILISIDENKSNYDTLNPYRTGGWAVVREEFIRRALVNEETIGEVCKNRIAYIPDDAWEALGLPRGAKDV